MPYEETGDGYLRLCQLKGMLEANDVPRPFILWLDGKALPVFLTSIGRLPFFRDGHILPDKFYRYNLDTGRHRQVEPYNPNLKKGAPHALAGKAR